MEVGKLHDTGTFTHLGTHTFNEPHTSSHGSTCGDEIVHQKHVLSWLDGVPVHFDPVTSIFEIVRFRHFFCRQLVGLPKHDKAALQSQCKRCTEHQTPCFQSGHRIDLFLLVSFHQEVHARLERLGIQHQRCHVPKQDAGFWKIGHATNAFGDHLFPWIVLRKALRRFGMRRTTYARDTSVPFAGCVEAGGPTHDVHGVLSRSTAIVAGG
mmetsp:Transcript_11182/g.68979  ORF Transcript_11182/g.68979 Transcript_11182/m.68979 type:complete len:210 (-) Transcript_11182:2643-3272(-)